MFGERTLNDGTTKRARVEYPNGEKLFDVLSIHTAAEK